MEKLKPMAVKPGHVRLAVYGTLRRGFYNHRPYGLDLLEQLGAGFIDGFQMWTDGVNYPSLMVKTGEFAYFEIYDVPRRAYQAIWRLEKDFGYHVHKTHLPKFGNVTIFAKEQQPVQPHWELMNVWRDKNNPKIGGPLKLVGLMEPK